MDLNYATVDCGGEKLLNHSKITKEDAFNIIKENSLKIISESSGTEFSDKCYAPPSFDIIKTLLEHDGVYATPETYFNHFIGETLDGKFSVCSMKSDDVHGLTKDVIKFLSRGLNVYIHSYYMMDVDRYIDDELTVKEKWYWYKIGLKKK